MSTVYKKSGERISNNYRRSFSSNPSRYYSFYQTESQNVAQGLYYETTLGKTIIDSLTRYIIGAGLTPMASPEYALLDWSEEQADRFQRQVEAFYRVVTTDRNFDYYGKNPYKELQKIAFKTIMNTGDVLLHRGYRQLRNGSVVPFIQLISGKLVMNPNLGADTSTLVGGVKLNPNTGRETGYCIQIIDDGLNDTYATKEVSKYNKELGFDEFTLISLQNSDPLQVRGIPLLTPVRDDILQVTKLKDNYLIRSVVQNLFAAAIEKTMPTDPGAQTVQEKLVQGMEAIEEEEPFEPTGDIKLDPGIVIELNEGEKMVAVQPSMQAEDFSAGLKSLIGIVSSSFGIPYEVLMSSYNASFSASRASINGAEKNFQTIREEFNTKFNDLVYELVVDYGIRTGAIEAPGYEKGGLYRKAILACTWVGVTPLQVDPVKEVNAYINAINAGLCSRETATRNLYGQDFEEVADRLIKEHSLLSKLNPEGNSEQEETQKASTREEEENDENTDEDEQ